VTKIVADAIAKNEDFVLPLKKVSSDGLSSG
jgi:hypothetical protein